MSEVITNKFDIWTSTLLTKSNAGRGTRGRQEAYGINKLRELILELAVRGKLVQQEDTDEPAHVLLEKIAKEKVRLMKEGAFKREKALPEITENEKPFPVPNGWVWARLQNVSSYIQRGKGPQYADYGKVQVVSQKCVQWSRLDLTQARYVDDASLDDYQPERFLRKGDLLWNSTGTGTVGRIVIVQEIEPNSLVADSHVTIIRPLLINSRFVRCYVSAPGIQGRIESDHESSLVSGTTKQVELNLSAVNLLIVPVPPLAEQHRIVAKVDELMTICDQLEKQQTHSLEAHQTLVETLLSTLTRVRSPQELSDAWNLISNHFDTLLSTEHSIDLLKQTILQLAVMGKLVPQDHNEEPASILMEKIAVARERLIEECLLKKGKPLPPLTDEELDFQLPRGWVWTKFAAIAEFINGDRSKNYPNRSEYVDEGVAWINTGHIEPSGRLTIQNMNFISREKFNSLNGGKIQKNDLVYCLRGATFGKTAFVEPYEEGAIASSLMIIRPFISHLNKYIFLYLVSPFGKRQLLRFDNGSAQPNLSAGSVMLYAFPLPPLAEQRRIVAKVDELIALCDALKTRLSEAQTTQIYLANAIVDQAVA